ncbi:hypothetical protein K469DRAFT_608033 [Zopfia rhizophila CBS 207.26]|uniref:Fungal N-terminal domain-containing protein n=1 Tax=Zopfia rhizophila CBS 207.26 TaxID=1314779 RepID=A0A6A6DCH3_9PEZI|nr:hypothetical protein K469DRAFT_608033 [Zopfia rhizophila CBS 207.26]
MGDPISVAGTAVGITSLGIQTCQGIIRYYEQFKNFDDEISATIQRVKRLNGILHALEPMVRHLELDNNAISEQVRLSLSECKEGLRNLERFAKRCGDTALPATGEDRVRLMKKRLLFPFRRDTLQDLHVTLDRLQDNLNSIIQALQL